MTRQSALLIALVAFVATGIGCSRKVVLYKDQHVVAYSRARFVNYINPHLSATKYIEIKGRTWSGLRGDPPFYLKIERLDSLIFVTEDRSFVWLHVVNLNSGEHKIYDLQGSSFGSELGKTSLSADTYSDSIQFIAPNELVLVVNSGFWKEITTIDLRGERQACRRVVNFESGKTNVIYYDAQARTLR